MRDWLSNNPELLALLILIVGWVAALCVRYAAAYGANLANRAAAGLGQSTEPLISQKMLLIIQRVGFWLVLLSAVALALETLGVAQMADGLDSLVGFVPSLLVALAILTVGHVIGLLGRELVAGLDYSQHTANLAKIVYGFVMLIAAVMALQQIGLDVSFLSELSIIFTAFVLGSLGLAFAIGARQLVANLTAQGELQRYKVGDRIRVDDLQGVVVEVHRTGLTIATQDGVVNLPAHLFASRPVVRAAEETDLER